MSSAITSTNSLSMNPVRMAITTTAVIGVPAPSTVQLPFDWRNTTDRLHKGLHRPLPFEDDARVRRHRRSIFREMGLHGADTELDTDTDAQAAAADILLSRAQSTTRPVSSGVYLASFFRFGFDEAADGDSSSCFSNRKSAAVRSRSSSTTASHRSRSLRKRLSWPLAGHSAHLQLPPQMRVPPLPKRSISVSAAFVESPLSLSPTTTRLTMSSAQTTMTVSATATGTSTGMSDRKRPWYVKLAGATVGRSGSRRLRNPSLHMSAKE